jgi:pimeloyl-ACP methyl ester carboxylesterase
MRGTTHALLADPYSGLVVLAAQDGNGLRLAYHHRQTGKTTFPTALSAIEGAVLPLAVAPGGRCVALQVRRGARTHLLRHRVADDRLTEVDFPAGIIGGVGAWSATGLRFPYSSPVCPSAIATVGTSWHLAGLDPGPERVPAHLEWFPGRTGDTEAVVYGDWRTAERVVVALHGGPEAAWDMGYQPMLQRLAVSGCAVVAPNQRGSIGYGAEHAAAIHDDWGGPDRIDVCRVGRVLTRGRPTAAQKPLLFGESYGAYLALLTAGHRPDLWSGCAAISPFLSGRRLRAEATPTVRALVDRLGGCGGGDVMPVVRRIEGALLVVHGDADTTVPVTQSRALRDHLRRPSRARFEYVEVPGAGHDPIASSAAAQDALARFLSD